MSTVGMLAWIEESFSSSYFKYLQKNIFQCLTFVSDLQNLILMVIYSCLLLFFQMARVKLIARKHIRVPPHRNNVPTESHSDGQNARYFPRTLQTVLLSLGYSGPPLFVGVSRLHRGKSYL
jgi:hypothetical protein